MISDLFYARTYVGFVVSKSKKDGCLAVPAHYYKLFITIVAMYIIIILFITIIISLTAQTAFFLLTLGRSVLDNDAMLQGFALAR